MPLRAPRSRRLSRARRALASFIILNCSNSSSNATVGAPATRLGARAARAPGRDAVLVRVVPDALGRARVEAVIALAGVARRTLLAHTAARSRAARRAEPSYMRARAVRDPRRLAQRLLDLARRTRLVRQSVLFRRIASAARREVLRRVRRLPRPRRAASAHGAEPSTGGAPLPRGAWRGGDGDGSRDSASLPSKSVLSTILGDEPPCRARRARRGGGALERWSSRPRGAWTCAERVAPGGTRTDARRRHASDEPARRSGKRGRCRGGRPQLAAARSAPREATHAAFAPRAIPPTSDGDDRRDARRPRDAHATYLDLFFS